MSYSSTSSYRLGFGRRSLSAWLVVGALVVSVLLLPGSAQAESESDAPVPEVVATSRPNYHYQAPEGSNLTYLARRSLQLETSDSKSLAGGALVAAETCLVQSLGADDLIFVDEAVVVFGQMIDDCLNQTDQLTEAQIECWARYLPIREDLDWIQPTSVSLPGGVGEAADPEGNGNDSEVADPNFVDDTGAFNFEDPNQDDGSSFSGWYWWLIVGLVIALGWYFMVLGRTWRSAPDDAPDLESDKKMIQPRTDLTSVKDDSLKSKEATNKKTKPRRRRSSKTKR